MNKNHDKCIDIAKGIGILFMVLGHASFPFSKFVYFFHIPLFFILAGYVFKDKYIDSWDNVKIFMFKRLKSLYLPYIICNLTFVFFNNFFIEHNIYTTNPLFLEGNLGNHFGIDKLLNLKDLILKVFYILLLATGDKLCGSTWFLKVLFFISIFFAIITYFLKKYTNKDKVFYLLGFLITTIFLIIGFIFYKVNFKFYQIGVIFSSSILFYIGYCIKKYNIVEKITFKIFEISFLILLISCFIFDKGINLSVNKYYNPLLLIIFSLTGFVFTIYISKLINKLKKISNIFQILGAKTLPILCLHLLFFKFVTYLQVILYSLPDYRLAASLCYYTEKWWILYTLVGIIGPLITNYLYLNIKNYFLFNIFDKIKININQRRN